MSSRWPPHFYKHSSNLHPSGCGKNRF